MFKKGFSLVETILYIGLLAVLLPSFVVVTIGYVEKSESIDPRIRMEEKAAIIFLELQHELAQATSVDVTHSFLGSDDSSFVLMNSAGASVTFARAIDGVTFIGGDREVSRLQRQTTTSTDWMTDADMHVDVWNVDVVRNDDGVLTGVNVLISMRVLNPDGSPFRRVEFTSDTTFSLQAPTAEL